MARSGYVLAGFETLATILNNFALKNTKQQFNENFTPEQVSNFLGDTCHGFLHSFGQNFTGKKNYDKYVKKESNLYKSCREFGFFNNSTFIADSGGFQASVGRIDPNETRLLIDLYHQFLSEEYPVFDRAFILDLPPGPGCKLFKSYDDIHKMNMETYSMAKNLPKEARDKMIYIHHFRTPRLWDIYGDILRTDGMFESFQHFGTGGIVANMASDTAIPCIIYVLPMIPLLKQAKIHNRSELRFHILGGANFRDILFYEMFKKVVQKTHGIELEISYDSSGLFKGLMIGRYFHMINERGVIRKVDIRTKNLNMRFAGNQRVIDIYRDLISNLATEFNFKQIPMTEIYDDNTGTFFEDVKVYSMFYMLRTYANVQEMMRKLTDEIYPLYEDGQYEEFSVQTELITRSINGGKITKKQRAKAHSLIKSLDMLRHLDEDYCKYIVNKHLAKDEFTDLDPRRQMMQI